MFTLTRTEIFSQNIKKSRFVALAAPVASEDAAKRMIAVQSDTTANHNCWAWRIGTTYRFSDDGEPSGTAGKPILQAIDGQALDSVVVVVTRWFGGILLGSGGLMRAYGGTAATCLRSAAKAEIIPMFETDIACGFSDLALVKARLLCVPHLVIESESFTASGAGLHVSLPVVEVRRVARLISDITSGRVQMALPEQ